LTTTALSSGSHAITVAYGGDDDLLGVTSGSISMSVAQDGTQVILVPHPVFKRRKVISLGLTAAIDALAPGSGTPSGTVSFLVKKKSLGTATLSDGAATLSLKGKSALKQAITVVYGGDQDFQSSTATLRALTTRALRSQARPMFASGIGPGLSRRGHHGHPSGSGVGVHRLARLPIGLLRHHRVPTVRGVVVVIPSSGDVHHEPKQADLSTTEPWGRGGIRVRQR
jgi:hypothetical protein